MPKPSAFGSPAPRSRGDCLSPLDSTRGPPKHRGHMKSGITARSIVLSFFVVLALYGAAFYGIEYVRHRKGPWQVDFRVEASGNPVVEIAQKNLDLSGVKIFFHGEHATNAPGTVRFDRVSQPVPFGKVIYEDLTFLPGVVTFDLFGHEIEILPRALIVNKKTIPWLSGATFDLWPTNKPAVPPKPPKAGR